MRNNESIMNFWQIFNNSYWWKIDNLNFLLNKGFNIPKWFVLYKLLDKEVIYSFYKKHFNNNSYIVISSANCEDWFKISYAWLFKSIYWFYNEWKLYEDIIEVFASINNNYLDLYEKKLFDV